MNLSVPIPSFIGGVSQQVKALRLPSQCSEMINGWPTVVQGLAKRPACSYYGDHITTSSADMIGWHLIANSENERFIIGATNGPGITAQPLYGSPQTHAGIPLSFPTGPTVNAVPDFSYLAGAQYGDLKFLTVQDFTFVVNRNKQVALLPDTTPEDSGASTGHAYLYFKSGGNDVTYNLTLKRATGSAKTFVVNTWDNTGAASSSVGFKLTLAAIPAPTFTLRVIAYNSSGAQNCDVLVAPGDTINSVAERMRAAIDAKNDIGCRGSGATLRIFQTSSGTTPLVYDDTSGAFAPSLLSYTLTKMLASTNTEDIAAQFAAEINTAAIGFTADRSGATVRLKAATAIEQFDWSDSLNNTSMLGFNREVERVEDLPPTCEHGYVVKVSAFEGEEADDYYVKFVANDGTGAFGKGSWIESIKPGIQYKLDPTTMPHKLTWNGTTFTFEAIAWDESLVGDENSNPPPSLVGQYIHDVFFSNGRLGFLAGPYVVMSEVNRYFNLWRTTVRQLLDGDPIDIPVQDSGETTLCHAIPWDSEIILFSETSQFALSGSPLLTPKTVTTKVIGRWDSLHDVRPQLAQNSILFAAHSGGYTQVWELYRVGDSAYFNASEITQEIPKYIKGMATNMSLSLMTKSLIVQTDDDPNTLYQYNWYIQGNQKVQSAWSKLVFSEPVSYYAFDETDGWLMQERTIAGPSTRMALTYMDWSPEQVDSGSVWSVRLDDKIHSDTCGSKTYSALNDETTVQLPLDVDAAWLSSIIAVTAASVNQEAGGAISVVGGTATFGTLFGGHTVVLSGDWRTEPFWLGTPIDFTYTFSQPTLQELMRESSRTLRDGLWRVDRGVIEFERSGNFETTVSLPGRDDSVAVWNSWQPGNSTLNTYEGDDGVFHFAVLGKADEVEASITSSSWFPMYLVAGEWHGFYTSRIGRMTR